MTTSVEILRGNHIKSSDTLPSLRAKLSEEGETFNLLEHNVQLKMKLAEENKLTVDDSATIEQPGRGIVTYDWSVEETETAGTYEVEFVATDSSGETISFPNNGFARLYIEEGL